MGDARHGAGPSDVGRCEANGRNHFSAAIFCGQYGHVKTSSRETHKDDVEIEIPALSALPGHIVRSISEDTAAHCQNCGASRRRARSESESEGPPQQVFSVEQ